MHNTVLQRVQQSCHQLQVAPDLGLATQALVHTCIPTYSKVIISCRTHQTSAADAGLCQLLMLADVDCVLQLMMTS